jgi:hypothetical protein
MSSWEAPAPPASAAALEPFAPEVIPTTRIPRHGHLCLLGVLVIVGLVGAGVLTLGVLHIRFFGVSVPQQAAVEIFSALGSMAELYLVTLAASLLVFPLLWHRMLLRWLAMACLLNRFSREDGFDFLLDLTKQIRPAIRLRIDHS